ncbi:hypothetical protein [Massilia niastensis]|uniref:hypothetical protein n=1 Tax=Massilia niastensis TaxID=544911 RepID=UPI000366F35D|nr:hypothetical protein [Massilia niastensis]
MNNVAWIGIIIWGILLTAFGLLSVPSPAETDGTVQAHDVVFLVAGGMLTCLIGITGLMGLMGWIPGLRKVKS